MKQQTNAHFDITLNDASRIQGEYKLGDRLVVFSHGFDVRRDSNGLFHDIAESLPEGFVMLSLTTIHMMGRLKVFGPL